MQSLKKHIIIYVLVLLSSSCAPENIKPEFKNEEKTEPMKFDPVLAKTLGADEYGMKSYVMAFLKAGPNRNRSEEAANQLQRAHLDNIKRLSEEGKLLVAGPFLDNGEVRGIYIFNVETVEEAKALSETDPAIKAGSLILELKPWYGPAGLQKIKEIQAMISEKSI